MNIAINGFGRIGRLALRVALLKHPEVTIGAVNTSGSMDMNGWMQLFKYDTAYGIFPHNVSIKKATDAGEIGRLVVNDKEIPFLAIREPEKIPWKQYGIHTVLESTGVFRTKEKAEKHLVGGAEKVIISAPPKDDGIPLCMLGMNEENGKNAAVISNCSCTTYSSAPVIKTVLDHFGIKKGSLTTIHAYTSDQRLLDGSHKKDVRRARAAAQNMIPTSSGAAKAVIKVIPELEGKFKAAAVRVPVIVGSLSDLTFITEKPVTVEAVNNAFKQEATGTFKGVMTTTTDPIVSTDIVGNDASAIVDLSLTDTVGDHFLKVFAWYDNEWSYAYRLVELALAIR